ncbi:hypothetical protein PPL_11136 [Heterostelium album PN500]|uniref:Uncharacterized protein n=1 Tax=Heterostelium pallidum (strain ATCC 26659 / Pp 5 / PN500) TaxID=670386 RepID=D3BT15_HETP5|nr:hypothetical protein PPL_11136 [Heterostelium album PN500]EFA75630.1 hypothetical protein PPL_11136 [Heterostelium album PN500]|eukprot:XP_020427764.1 hypothetical protein PPL_11136 [Heterostelium album PN500]
MSEDINNNNNNTNKDEEIVNDNKSDNDINKNSSLFKSRNKKRAIRKKEQDNGGVEHNDSAPTEKIDNENGDRDDVDNELSLSDVIEATKEKQKMRSKGKGVNVGVLAEGPHLKTHLRELENKLDDSFVTHSENNKVNIHMEKYINEEMQRRKQEQLYNKQVNTTVQQSSKETNQDIDNNNNKDVLQEKIEEHKALQQSLYETPSHLLVNKGRKKEEDKTNWVAGISEVVLPTKYKIKNILETEEAREKIDQSGNTNTTTTNKNQSKLHNRCNYNNVHASYTNESSSDTNQYEKSSDKATDEEVYERFKKKFRY